MNAKRLRELILYIVSEVTDMDGVVSTIRLVKLLYIIDLEFYRRFGETLTGLNWVYHHYGPYVRELPTLLQNTGLSFEAEEFVTKEGHRGTSFHAPYFQDTPDWLPTVHDQIIKGLLNIWDGQDTDELLQYVYNTEPIKLGTRYQPINFSLASRGTKYVEIYVPPLPAEFVKRIKESITSYANSQDKKYVKVNAISDKVLQEGLAALDANEHDFVEFTGAVEVADPNILTMLQSSED